MALHVTANLQRWKRFYKQVKTIRVSRLNIYELLKKSTATRTGWTQFGDDVLRPPSCI